MLSVAVSPNEQRPNFLHRKELETPTSPISSPSRWLLNYSSSDGKSTHSPECQNASPLTCPGLRRNRLVNRDNDSRSLLWSWFEGQELAGRFRVMRGRTYPLAKAIRELQSDLTKSLIASKGAWSGEGPPSTVLARCSLTALSIARCCWCYCYSWMVNPATKWGVQAPPHVLNSQVAIRLHARLGRESL